MSLNNNYVNADGLEVRWGGKSPVATALGLPSNSGEVLKSAFVDFKPAIEGLPSLNNDANADGTAEKFTHNVAFIPEGSIVLDAYVIVRTATAGGTITFSLVDVNGNALSTLGTLAAAGGTAAFTIGTPILTKNAYLKATQSAAVTAGDVRVAFTFLDSGVRKLS